MANFSSVLKSLRSQKKMTQQELANSIGLSKSALNMYEQGARQPNFETLELIADYFNISIDFLLGKSPVVHCPICYNTYDPLNKYDSAEHEAFHKKFLAAERKYGKILLYGEADKQRSYYISKLNNPTLSTDERIDAFEQYLKYDFMRSIWNSHFDLSHEDFGMFCKKEMGLASTKDVLDNIGETVYETLCEKYGVADDTVYHEVTSFRETENSLNSYEISLIGESRKMNQHGKNKLLDTAKEMNCNPLYNYDYQIELAAAHERTDIPVTNKMKKHDDDIMDDENF
ncbi:helix-turn-helix transcriptional regulator [Mediterraneibacter sp. NSJ-55]|uniref:Helix-turn-helix transcriptional regulator n=1 Tax=Mediterraneibacter hominis TaxID=2763054 RepID=A0A923LJ98_9FIRM|nr:helix-turn-helix transcriptional regulator [Mediterraneibacter hominis]MBC5689741.1 helix-turn-helix transcriptional regulator [Mediterraneibacter hominis]